MKKPIVTTRSQRLRPRKLTLERMEERRVLAGYGANVLSTIEGLVTAGQTSEHTFEIKQEQFALVGRNETVSLQFIVRPKNCSSLVAQPVQIETLSDRAADVLYSSDSTLDIHGSVTVAAVREGIYRLLVRGIEQTEGEYELIASLVGDVNGDRQVNDADATLHRALLNSQQGDSRYVLSGDYTHDGRITGLDNSMLIRNRGAASTAFTALRFLVNSDLHPSISELPRLNSTDPLPRTLSRLVATTGEVADFVDNELYLVTNDDVKVQEFVDRWRGTILASINPAEHGFSNLQKMHLVQIQTDMADVTKLEENLRQIEPNGAFGQFEVSSERGRKLLAAAANEAAAFGTFVGVSWVGEPSTFSDLQSIEAPEPERFMGLPYDPNAFTWPHLASGTNQDIGVTEAWRMLQNAGVLRRIEAAAPWEEGRIDLAVFDNGFYPNEDWPSYVPFPNLGMPFGTPTPWPGKLWHGTSVVQAAAAVPDNGFGAAGPGGPVLNIMAVPTTYDPFLTIAGLIAVSAAGADIVNMSFHIPVPFLLSWTIIPYDLVTRSVRSIGGTLIFAAAGNEGSDIDAKWDLLLTSVEKTWYTPAENGGVIAVGGLDYDATTRHSASNYGREQVDIFAPYVVYSGPSDPLVPDNVARLSSGTSVSAPFAAAVAGLIWAADPDLTADQVETILFDTATVGTNQLRGNGNRIVNARRAVAAVLGDTPPSVEIVRPESGQEFVKFRQAIAFSAIADDLEGPVLVQWTSNRDGLIAQGTDFSIIDLSYGEHEITVTATDSSGQTSTDSISLRILAEDPTVNILSPTAGEPLIAGPIRFTAITRDNDYAFGQVPDNLVQWRYYSAATGDAGRPFDMRGHEVTQTFAAGTYLIHVIASDGFSGRAEQFLSITVAAAIANAPVIHRITPTSGSVFFAEGGNNFVEVELEALVTDVEDGELDGPSLVWTTNLASLQPLGEAILGTGRRTRARLYTGDSGNLHTVTLTATDSDGNSRTQRVGIWARIFI